MSHLFLPLFVILLVSDVYGLLPPPPPPPRCRTISGVNNSLGNPLIGSAGTPYIRLAPSDYANGIDAPSGANRPSARLISNLIAAHPSTETKSARGLTNFAYAWGQFLDHDLDLTETVSSAGSMPILVPAGDSSFDPSGTGTATIPMTRSKFVEGVSSPRQQVNSITTFVDGSMVYGSDTTTANSLRVMSNGQMKVSANGLLPQDASGMFQAGDVRANENPELTSLQTLFVREHNQIANRVQQQNPSWNDEMIYQQARRRVIAEIEAITYNEWLPAILPVPLPPYQGYDPNANPSISNEFAAAAFRFGHSMVGDDIEFLDNDGNAIAPPMSLKDAFFNPQVITTYGIEPLLKYLASDLCEEIDSFIVDSLRNFLFGAPGQGGLDLAALNIQRGRDHGLLNYNEIRRAYGLPKVAGFNEITSNSVRQQQLQSLYGNVNNIDLWVGGLAEDHVPGGNLGPTFTRILTNQFQRLRAGDRFWYEADFAGSPELSNLRATRLSDVIKRNTPLTNIQANVFFLDASFVPPHRSTRQRIAKHQEASPSSSRVLGAILNHVPLTVFLVCGLLVAFALVGGLIVVVRRSFSSPSSRDEIIVESVPDHCSLLPSSPQFFSSSQSSSELKAEEEC